MVTFEKGMPIAIGNGRVFKKKPNKILWGQKQIPKFYFAG